MRILITGGRGFIGGRTALYLREQYKDSDITITTTNNEALPSWFDDFNMMEMSLEDEKSIERAVSEVDTIVHLAAANEIDSMRDPAMAIRITAEGTYRLLRAAAENGVRKFIYFSTIHVYGENIDRPIITEQTPIRPYHPYATTHAAAEGFVDQFRRYNGMTTAILRLSNAYGAPADRGVNRWSLVFNDLCRQAVTTGELTLKSSGRQYRDFISIRDVARAVEHLIYELNGQWGDGLYNLGGECPMTILEAAGHVARVYEGQYGRQISAIKAAVPSANESFLTPTNYSIEKIKQTGFRLEGNMDEEIGRCLKLCEGFVDV
ncbi:MAG: SDR family oxidoreductase [Candidatus Magnetominusculus sp. LBB02]|nr:SDR family oxidoreductase [Candidatus Magnetominusculus sp. LBB02]